MAPKTTGSNLGGGVGGFSQPQSPGSGIGGFSQAKAPSNNFGAGGKVTGSALAAGGLAGAGAGLLGSKVGGGFTKPGSSVSSMTNPLGGGGFVAPKTRNISRI